MQDIDKTRYSALSNLLTAAGGTQQIVRAPDFANTTA